MEVLDSCDKPVDSVYVEWNRSHTTLEADLLFRRWFGWEPSTLLTSNPHGQDFELLVEQQHAGGCNINAVQLYMDFSG